MPHTTHSLSRRDFLKLAGLGVGTLALRPFARSLYLPEFPAAERLGRNCTNGKIPVKARPYVSADTVKEVYEDTVFPWLREVTADAPDYNRNIQRWVETPDGYVYSPYLQPVRNLPNTPLPAIPDGKAGFWAEVTVPYVDFILENSIPIAPSMRYLTESKLPMRLYYSQVFWIDQVKVSDVTGNIIYRVNENGGRPDGVTGGSYGDLFWVEGAAFRPLTVEDVAPISPDVDPATKKVVVNLTFQTLSCLEGEREVYFCRVSTGVRDEFTPIGEHTTWRKTFSIHMAGGTVDAGYDTAGVSWTTLFSGEGIAIHSAFWHNQFGEKRSHGCVNCAPEDAKWIFRWTSPSVNLDQCDLTAAGTHVLVEKDL